MGVGFSSFIDGVLLFEDWDFFFVAFYGFLENGEHLVSMCSCDEDVDEFFAGLELAKEVVNLDVRYSFSPV